MIRFYWSSFAHFKREKILRLVYSLEQNLKWNILFLFQYQDLFFISTFSTISKFLPLSLHVQHWKRWYLPGDPSQDFYIYLTELQHSSLL